MNNPLERNLEFDQPIKNTLALTPTGRTLGATWFVNGSRHFIRLIEPNPFGIDTTLRIIPCESNEAARILFNDVQNNADEVCHRLGIR